MVCSLFLKDDDSDDSSIQTRSQEERDAAVDKAMAEGSGTLYQSNIVLQGPPGSGKSSLKRALLGLDPLPKEQQTATDIVEKAVRAISIDKVNNFEVIENDKLIEMFADEVTSMKNQILAGDIKITNLAVLEALSNPGSLINDVTTPVIASTRSPSVLSIMKALDRGTGPLKIYDTNWYHVIDSGGQPQFSDILPLVHLSPSLNIAVVRLTESLDDRPPVRFYEEGRDVYSLPDRLCLSNREMIVRMCQIAASCKASGANVVPYVMIVGTHLDKLGDLALAKIREFNEGLKEIRKEFGHVLICKSEDETIFPINAMAEGDERRECTRELQECIITFTRQNVTPDTVPLRWLVYQLDLDKGKGVVKIEDCYKGGKPFGMDRVAVEDSLRFLSKVALVHYFPEDIPDLVLTKTDPLIGRLSKLVKSSFLPPKFLPSAESERLRIKGLFSKSYLSKVFADDFDLKELSNEKFLQMLQLLKIAVRVSEDEYFLPSALSLEPNVEQSIAIKISSIPLVFTWRERFLPHGFFFTVIVELLTRNGDYKFELRTNTDQWRGEIQVREASGKIPGVITLTNRTKWIQVSSSDSDGSCPATREEVKNAISETIKRFKDTGIGDPVVATLCPLCESNDHYCLLTSDKKKFTCDANNSLTGNVPENILCWFQGKHN